MFDFLFFIKTIVATILLVLALQIQVGGATLESRADEFIHSASIMQPIKSVSEGAAQMIRRSAQWLAQKLNSSWSGRPAEKGWEFRRSDKYQSERAKQNDSDQ